MKLNIKRETTIGLSVLLVLLVILGTVAARRFMRPNLPFDAAVARAEEKSLEGPPGDHREREADSFSKPALLTPVEMPHRDGMQSLDEPGHWDTTAKERKRETPTNSAASTLIVADPPTNLSLPVNSKSDRREDKREGERKAIHKPPEVPAAASDERYSPATNEPFAERQKRDISKSMVIQVSDGERPDGPPRPLDRDAADRRPFEPYQSVQPGPERAVDTIPRAPAVDRRPLPPDGPMAGMAVDREAARLRAEQAAREHGYRSDPPTAGGAYVPAPASRYSYDAPPNSAAAPTGDAMSNYSVAPGGYSPENSLRHGDDLPDRMRSQPRLRDDGMCEVQPNDSYWTISERVYGSGAYFRALAEQNRGKAARPDRLPPGLMISTPPIAQLEKDYPDLCPRPNRRETVRIRTGAAIMAATAGGGRTYVVQEGDTLSSISRNELGKVSRWAEIYQLNREALGKDYDYLTPGMRLVLPMRDPSSGDRTTRRDDHDVPLMR
ncbi:MAG: LysM peptidoglycan-binding domain-containing protein [Thermoguttaceae bacterium]